MAKRVTRRKRTKKLTGVSTRSSYKGYKSLVGSDPRKPNTTASSTYRGQKQKQKATKKANKRVSVNLGSKGTVSVKKKAQSRNLRKR